MSENISVRLKKCSKKFFDVQNICYICISLTRRFFLVHLSAVVVRDQGAFFVPFFIVQIRQRFFVRFGRGFAKDAKRFDFWPFSMVYALRFLAEL